MELLRNVIAFPSRVRHRWQNRRRLAVSANLQRTLKSNGEKARDAGLSSYSGIYNVALYVAIAEHDLSTYSEELVFSRSEWHRKFHARGLAVLLFEVAEDLPELLGKQYRQWLLELKVPDLYMERLNAIGKSLSTFRKAHEPFLSNIRNYIGAHRDHDAFVQFDVLEKLDVFEVFRLAPELSQPIRGLVSFHTDLLQFMGQPSVILEQLAHKAGEV
ncbi:MAG: hypothetical protein ACK4F6_12120 [Hylemonella sp.]